MGMRALQRAPPNIFSPLTELAVQECCHPYHGCTASEETSGEARATARTTQYIYFPLTELAVQSCCRTYHYSPIWTAGGRPGAWTRTRAYTFDPRTIYMAIVRSAHLWDSYTAIVCSTHLWNSYTAIVCYMNDKSVEERVAR